MPAGADPDFALALAKEVATIYGQAVDDMLELVARRLARGIDEPGWAERKLLEQTRLRDDARAIVERVERLGPEAARRAVDAAWLAGSAQGAAEMGLSSTLTAHTHTRAVDALAREAVGSIERVNSGILRSVDDIYRQVIAQTSAPGVLTGTQTRRQAAQRALDRFAKEGVKGFVDRAGRNWQLDSYAEMATRTAAGRAQVAGTLDRFTEAGRDLVIVSDAPEECRLCRPWEGKVLSISGATSGALDRGFSVAGTVGDAQAAGLQHANCRHSLGAYVPGLTRRMTNTEDPHGDTIRQEQRMLEREKRKWLRVEAVGLDDQAKRVARQQVAVFDGHLRQITDDRHAYAAKRAEFLRNAGHPGAAKWERTAAGIKPGTEGKRLRYREQIGKAH